MGHAEGKECGVATHLDPGCLAANGAQLVGQALQRVARLDLLAHQLVLLAEALRLGDHAVHLGVGEATALVADADLVGGPRVLVLGGHVQNAAAQWGKQKGDGGSRERPPAGGAAARRIALGVEVEGNLDLRLAAPRALDAGDGELAQQVVAVHAAALALVDAHVHRGLEVGLRRVHLAAAHRDGRVALE